VHVCASTITTRRSPTGAPHDTNRRAWLASSGTGSTKFSASDVSWKVINTLINWRHYKIAPEVPIAIVVHLCSTKIPYKSVGKEFIADRPEVEREILNSVRELARKLSLFISRKANVEREKEKIDLFTKYMPKIAHFSAKLAGKSKDADIEPLLKNIGKLDTED